MYIHEIHFEAGAGILSMKMLLACTKVDPKLGIFSFNLIGGSSAGRVHLGTQNTLFISSKLCISQVWWQKPAILTQKRKGNPKFKVSLGYWARWRAFWAPHSMRSCLKITTFPVYCLRKKVGSTHVWLENWQIHSRLPEQRTGSYHLAISRNPWRLKPETLRIDQEMTQAGASGVRNFLDWWEWGTWTWEGKVTVK